MTQEQFSPKDKDFDVRFGEFFDKLGEGWKPIFQLAERINNMKESDLKKLTASDLERLKNLPAELDRQTLEEAEAILSSIETKEN